ncbi:MAG: c-type cytochrome [Leptospiraceae bacterium]|nr:c-type cytochrome [Leptospiraceae bacterium]
MKEPKEVDGIFQADNPMPGWWTFVWALTIIFSIGYVIYFHYFSDWPQEKAFAIEAEEHEKKFPRAEVKANDDGSNPLRENETAIAEGQKNFVAVCAACHKADGTGLVGPNLMDPEWLHGASDAEVFENIMKGIGPDRIKTNRGIMPPHDKSLGAEKVYQIMAWLAKNNESLKKVK